MTSPTASPRGLSKYAAKQLAKATGTWTPPEESVPAATSPPGDGTEGFRDLGTLPEQVATALRGAEYAAIQAERLCQAILRKAPTGIQSAEPRSIMLAVHTLARKAHHFARRAEVIINAHRDADGHYAESKERILP